MYVMIFFVLILAGVCQELPRISQDFNEGSKVHKNLESSSEILPIRPCIFPGFLLTEKFLEYLPP